MSTEYYNSGGEYKTREGVGSPKTKACQLWENIRNRCEYLPVVDEVRFGKYADVDSCPEWKDFQNFAAWFESVQESGYYTKGFQLEKDILFKGNKIYSPETCVFLPEEVNKGVMTNRRIVRELPIGLSYSGKGKNAIIVSFNCKYPEFKFLKYVARDQVEEGFQMYKQAREKYIHHLAEKYKDVIDPRAYKALAEFEISIDD